MSRQLSGKALYLVSGEELTPLPEWIRLFGYDLDSCTVQVDEWNYLVVTMNNGNISFITPNWKEVQ